MWASFTRDEKYLLLGFLSLLGIGTVALPFIDSRRQTEVFSARNNTISGSAAATTSSLVSVPNVSAFDTLVVPGQLSGIDASGRIDLNSATGDTLEGLPGIGPSRAEAILQLRQQRGAFRAVEELDDVPGIGPVTLGKLRALVTVSAVGVPGSQSLPTSPAAVSRGTPTGAFAGTSALAPKVLPAPLAPGPSSSPSVPPVQVPHVDQAPAMGVVNINKAMAEELATLKYVGPKLSERIIIYRHQYGPFRTPQDLIKVKGIGTHVLKENYGRITVQ